MLSKTPHDNFTMSAHYHSRPQETRIKKKSTLIRQLLQTDFLLIQIDYKNHVSVQMATETFGLFKKCLQNGALPIPSTGPQLPNLHLTRNI